MSLLPITKRSALSDYEMAALQEIQQWRTPEKGWFRKTVDGINDVFHQATDLIRKVPGVEWTIENVIAGILRLTNEIMQDSVWTDAIYKEYKKAGHPVTSKEDIRHLDLEIVDKCLKGLDAKYRTLAAVEGAATGYAGLPGIVPDIIALVAMNLRAAGEHAAYCGFDISNNRERLYALQILDAASSEKNAKKQVAFSPLVRVSSRLARKQAIRQIEDLAISRAIREVAERLGLHLARAKLAQIIPVTGAVVGSGFNALYTTRVTETAYYLYRERFLFYKYGPDIGQRN